jgi:hypothetical protein
MDDYDDYEPEPMPPQQMRARHVCVSLYPDEEEYLSRLGGGPRARGRGRGRITGVTEGIRKLIEMFKAE